MSQGFLLNTLPYPGGPQPASRVIDDVGARKVAVVSTPSFLDKQMVTYEKKNPFHTKAVGTWLWKQGSKSKTWSHKAKRVGRTIKRGLVATKRYAQRGSVALAAVVAVRGAKWVKDHPGLAQHIANYLKFHAGSPGVYWSDYGYYKKSRFT